MTPSHFALVVDDDPMLHVIGEAALLRHGFEHVEKAASGRAALAIVEARGGSIDLVVTDLNMPDTDGLQFIRSLADVGFSGDLIIVSGEDQDVLHAARDLAGKHGLNVLGALRKPVDPLKIAALLSVESEGGPARQARSMPDFSADDVASAISRRAIRAVFQPKVAARTGEVTGFEALARWQHPDHGVISPDVFVPICEAAGLVPDLTFSILQDSLALLSRLPAHWSKLSIAINTDAETVREIDFPDRATQACQSYGIQNSRLTFEVTERSLLDENVASIEVLARLRMAGYGVSVDDFGTGHTNLRQLCVYPFTELKIDRSFLADCRKDHRHMTCLHAIANLGKALGLEVIAEGIETDEELALVERIGVDALQGYLFARPMSSGDILRWLDTRGTTQPTAQVS
ncbi:MAG: EAL domain-containing response regulator [Pseudomonadota bacterium]